MLVRYLLILMRQTGAISQKKSTRIIKIAIIIILFKPGSWILRRRYIGIITSLATSEEKSKLSENKVRGVTSDNEDNNTNDVSFLPPHAMSSLVSASEASGSSTSSLIKLYAPLLPSIMGDDVSDYTDDIIIEDMMMSEEPVRPQRHYWSQSWSKITTNETTSRVSSRIGACEVGSIVVGASAVGATIVGAFVTGALVVGFSVMGASALVVCIVTAGSYTARA